MSPNRKTNTQAGKQTSSKKTCPIKQNHQDKSPQSPTRRLKPKENIKNQPEILALERRFIKNMLSDRKAKTQTLNKIIKPAKNMSQEGDSLRKLSSDVKTDSQLGNQKSDIKICPRRETHLEKRSPNSRVKAQSCCLVRTYVERCRGTSPGPWTLA